MAHVAWTLTDNSTGSPVVYSFPVNPNTFQSPGRQASISQESTTAPNGTTILFQGQDKAPTGSFGGAIMSASMLADIQTWANKWYVLTLTDDQSRTWDILITGLSLDRLRRATNQNRFNYQIDFLAI